VISGGSAIPFTAHATSPTITMPRVKAITTGSIPGFLDVILNFAESDTMSSLALQDNWLAQIKANEGKLVMYGDDTWLKLFPGMFERSDGTSSFFVSVSQLAWLAIVRLFRGGDVHGTRTVGLYGSG
jgi:ethanolaminephosphotransferase